MFFPFFSFNMVQIDMALRKVFKKMRLPKEFQEIERVVKAFSKVYWDQNQETDMLAGGLWNMENIELMAMSVLILNTNIHSDKIPRQLKLTKYSFVKT